VITAFAALAATTHAAAFQERRNSAQEAAFNRAFQARMKRYRNLGVRTSSHVEPVSSSPAKSSEHAGPALDGVEADPPKSIRYCPVREWSRTVSRSLRDAGWTRGAAVAWSELVNTKNTVTIIDASGNEFGHRAGPSTMDSALGTTVAEW